jgi:uncharacterized membrane protein
VIAGIMWIGNSLLFNWLDRSLQPPGGAGQTRAPIGKIWLLHSGGFYYVEKTLLEGEPLPKPMHWFKWQAYTTWLSGFALLVILYYLSDRAILADSSVANLSHRNAIIAGLGAIVLGWGLYEAMQRFVAPRAAPVAAVIWLGGLLAISYALTHLLSGRAAYLHVGAMLGTIMAGNVFFTIVPSQRELERSVVEARGGAASAVLSARAKRVSIHNNYFTFPVIALMVSNHFSAIYGAQDRWALLLVICAGGAAARHVLNIRWKFPQWQLALAAVILLTLWGLHIFMHQGRPAAASNVTPVTATFADARHIIDRRCGQCQSSRPTDDVNKIAPVGVMFDTPEQIVARASRIRERAYVTRTMPPNNKTNITDEERAVLGAWSANPGLR